MKTLWIRIGKIGAYDEAFLATVGERGFIKLIQISGGY